MYSNILLSATHLAKTYGEKTLFELNKLEIYDDERIALVGSNGCGKTTLLRILADEVSPDAGEVTHYSEFAFIHQLDIDKQESEMAMDLQLVSEFRVSDTAGESGGEKMRLALAEAFSQRTPLLFADEPSSNLDMDGISVLEEKLAAYPGAVVLVSHDRSLLDSVCNTVWEISEGQMRVFPGTYSAWLEQRELEREYAQFEYEKYQAEKKRISAEICNVRDEARNLKKPPKHMGSSEWKLYKEVAARQQKNVQNRAKAMAKRIDHMEEKRPPRKLPQISMLMGSFTPVRSRIAARIQGLTVNYGSHMVVENTDFILPTGSKTVMLGLNGSGKSTIVKALVTKNDSASFPNAIKIGYFSQDRSNLDFSKSILENVRKDSVLREADIRGVLANLYLTEELINQPVGKLSGGEMAKTEIAKLLVSDSNLLILDEPTNHLDLYAIEALESLLSKWNGTLLLITHDRMLTEKIADRLLFVENQGVKTFDGSWADWVESQQPKQTDEDIARLKDEICRARDAYTQGFTM